MKIIVGIDTKNLSDDPTVIPFTYYYGQAMDLGDNIAVVAATTYSFVPPLLGYVFIYEFDGTSWNKTGTLHGSVVTDGFGADVKIYNGQIFVGAPNSSIAGTVFVYSKNNNTWQMVLSLTPSYAGDSFFGISLSVAYGILAVGSSSSTTCRVYFYSNATLQPDYSNSKIERYNSGNGKNLSAGVITVIVIVVLGGTLVIFYSTYKYLHRSNGISSTLTAGGGGAGEASLSIDSASALTGMQRIVKLVKNICCNTEYTNRKLKSMQDEKKEKALDSIEM